MQTYLAFVLLYSVNAQLIATFLFGSSSTISYSHAVKNVKNVVPNNLMGAVTKGLSLQSIVVLS